MVVFLDSRLANGLRSLVSSQQQHQALPPWLLIGQRRNSCDQVFIVGALPLSDATSVKEEHLIHMWRALPGGLDLLGVMVADGKDSFSATTMIKTWMNDLGEFLREVAEEDVGYPTLLVLHVSPNQSLTLHSFSEKTSFRLVSLNISPFKLQWFGTRISLNGTSLHSVNFGKHAEDGMHDEIMDILTETTNTTLSERALWMVGNQLTSPGEVVPKSETLLELSILTPFDAPAIRRGLQTLEEDSAEIMECAVEGAIRSIICLISLAESKPWRCDELVRLFKMDMERTLRACLDVQHEQDDAAFANSKGSFHLAHQVLINLPDQPSNSECCCPRGYWKDFVASNGEDFVWNELEEHVAQLADVTGRKVDEVRDAPAISAAWCQVCAQSVKNPKASRISGDEELVKKKRRSSNVGGIAAIVCGLLLLILAIILGMREKTIR